MVGDGWLTEVNTRIELGGAKGKGGSGGKLPISFTDFETLRIICYLSFIQ